MIFCSLLEDSFLGRDGNLHRRYMKRCAECSGKCRRRIRNQRAWWEGRRVAGTMFCCRSLVKRASGSFQHEVLFRVRIEKEFEESLARFFSVGPW